jgi:hypothetical protein
MKLAINPCQQTDSQAGAVHSRLNQLKKTVRRQLAERFSYALPAALIHRLVDEAEQYACETGFPHLVLPLLAEESVRLISPVTHDEVISPENDPATAAA